MVIIVIYELCVKIRSTGLGCRWQRSRFHKRLKTWFCRTSLMPALCRVSAMTSMNCSRCVYTVHVSLRCTSAVVLCYSVAEYCVPAWGRSSHVKLVNRQLNETMWIVSGTIRPTPLQWLPVLSHILPSHVLSSLQTLSIISKGSLMFLFTRTSVMQSAIPPAIIVCRHIVFHRKPPESCLGDWSSS